MRARHLFFWMGLLWLISWIIACVGVLTPGEESIPEEEVDLFLRASSSGDLIGACQELKDLCDSTGKGCKAYQYFCDGTQTSRS